MIYRLRSGDIPLPIVPLVCPGVVSRDSLVCPVHGCPMTSRVGQYGKYHLCLRCPPREAFMASRSSTDGLWRVSCPMIRSARSLLHHEFDQIWRGRRPEHRLRAGVKNKPTRVEAYRWLAASLGLRSADCHFAHMSLCTLRRALRVVRDHVGLSRKESV